MFDIGITSNIKEYYSGYIDFIDHYWLNYFEKKNINYYLIPNKKKTSIKILNKINLLIIPGGNDVSDFLKTSSMRNSIENKLFSIKLYPVEISKPLCMSSKTTATTTGIKN